MVTVKVFLSFKGILRDMRDNKVSEQDLSNGLFYFECSRDWVLQEPPEQLTELKEVFGRNTMLGFCTITRLRSALLIAEEEARVAWKPIEGKNSIEQLSDLLERNGGHPLPYEHLSSRYDARLMLQAITATNGMNGTLFQPML